MNRSFLILCIYFLSSFKTQIEDFLVDISLEHHYSGMKYVDCIYVINLAQRPEKWEATKNAFEAFRIYPNRVNAVYGKLLTQEQKQLLFGNYPIRLRDGEIGCILSHVSVLRDAYNRGFKVAWVCEDDVKLCINPHHLSQKLELLSKIDSEWDILFTDLETKHSDGQLVPSLSSDFRPDVPHKDLSYYLRKQPIGTNFIRIYQRFGAYSFFISKKGIEKLLKHFNENYLWASYDVDMHYALNLREYTLLREYVSFYHEKSSDTNPAP